MFKKRTLRKQWRILAKSMLWTAGPLWGLLWLADFRDASAFGIVFAFGLGVMVGTSKTLAADDPVDPPSRVPGPPLQAYVFPHKSDPPPGPPPVPEPYRPYRQTTDYSLPPSLAESGNWPPPKWAIHEGILAFTYVDAEGEVTERRVKRWKPDPQYSHCFTAHDLDRGGSRTFRIDRVDSWGE